MLGVGPHCPRAQVMTDAERASSGRGKLPFSSPGCFAASLVQRLDHEVLSRAKLPLGFDGGARVASVVEHHPIDSLSLCDQVLDGDVVVPRCPYR